MSAEYAWWHRFNTLVDRKIAEPLECQCGYRLHMLGGESGPILKCYKCDTVIVPGLNTKDRVRRTVEEYDKRRTSK